MMTTSPIAGMSTLGVKTVRNNPLRHITAAAGAVANYISLYISSHTDGIVALTLACAMAVVFTGRTLLQPTVFLMGFIPTFAYFQSIGFEMLPEASRRAADVSTTHFLPMLVTTVAVLLGFIAGTIMVRLLFKPAILVITAASGVVAVLVVYHLFFQSPEPGSNDEAVLATMSIIGGLLFGLLSLLYPRTMVIFGTAYDGAAMAVYALAFFLGNQPYNMSGLDTTDKRRLWSLGYAIATLTLGSYGAFIQTRVAAADRGLTRRRSSRISRERTGSEASAAAVSEESGRLLPPPSYGSIQGEFVKVNGLGAPPLLPYEDEEARMIR